MLFNQSLRRVNKSLDRLRKWSLMLISDHFFLQKNEIGRILQAHQKSFMKILLSTFFILCVCTISNCQLQINSTVNYFDFDEFNQSLASNQFPTFREESLSITAINISRKTIDSRFGTRNGFIFTLFETEQNIDIDPMTPNAEQTTKMRSIAFMSGFEYAIIKNRFFTIAPSLDVLFSQQRLILTNNFPIDPTFGNVLASDAQIETFRNIRLMLDGRINIMFHFGRKQGSARYGLGITGGYRLDPTTPTWRYERSVDIDIPGSRQNGLEFGLLFILKLPKLSEATGQNKKEQRS